ncbi:MAG: DUF3783 domain-containing protein [Deltaproteobacteria bacterium]|nr:DUF3783 domain-containing protein [Deltaproteobacteria bacterium]
MNDVHHEKLAKGTERTFPGPRLFLVSGYDTEDINTLAAYLQSIGYSGVKVKGCAATQIEETLETVLHSDIDETPAGRGQLPNTMIFSGMMPSDVQRVMRTFSQCGLQRPIFATTTPTNLSYTMKKLLLHLLEEQRAAIGASTPQSN